MKKTKYLVAALLLMGATTTFTSCIDNDEPAGITELRGAKAELLKAKAVVEQARAQYILAEAKVQEALAAKEQANAAYREAEAKQMQAIADREAAFTEAEKARYDKLIADYQNQMQEAAKRQEILMVQLEEDLAEAKRSYELTLKQIEIAEAVMSEKDKVTVQELKDQANNQFALIYGGTYTDASGKPFEVVDKPTNNNQIQSLVGKVSQANDDYYEAMMDQVQTPGVGESENFIPQLELNLELAEAKLASANEKVAKLEAFLEEDVETNDWRKEVEELEDSINILSKEKSELLIQAEEVKSSEEYINAAQTYLGISKDGNFGSVNSDGTGYKLVGTAQKKNAAENELEKALRTEKAAIEGVEVETTNKVMQIVTGNTSTTDTKYAVIDLEDKGLFALNEGVIEIAGDLKTSVEDFEDFIETAKEASASLNDAASAELELEALKKTQGEKETAYKAAIEKWQISLKAYKGEATDATPTKADLSKAVSGYNTALNTLVSKVTAYNNSYKSIYDAAYSKREAEYKAELRAAVFSGATTGIPTQIQEGIDKVNDFFTDLGGNWGTFPLTKTEANALAYVETLMKEANPNETAANISAKQAKLKNIVDDVVNPYLITSVGKEDVDDKAKAFANAEIAKAEAADKELGKAKKAITDAEAALTTKKTAISTEYSKWTAGELSTIYAQSLTEDARKVNLDKLLGFDKLSDVEPGYTYVGFVKDSSTVLEVKVNDLTTEEYADYTETELDENKTANAWQNGSELAFGTWTDGTKWAVIPSEEEMRKGIEAGVSDGAYYEYLNASDDVKECEEKISAADDLKKFVEDLDKAFTDYEAAIEKAKTEAYGEEIKTYDDAIAANKTAKAAYEAEELKYKVASLDADKVQIKIDVLIEVRTALVNAIKEHLGIDLVDSDGTSEEYDVVSFTEQLKATINVAKQEVVNAQRDVEVAKINLEKAQNGEFDKVSLAKAKLDAAIAELQKAQANYDAIMANIEKALEIMAKTAE